MAENAYNAQGKVAYFKCKQRCRPPMGISCTRIKTIKTSNESKGPQARVADKMIAL